MKKFFGLLFVALLGGFGALVMNQYIFSPPSNEVIVSHTIPHRFERVPSAFVSNPGEVLSGLPDFTSVAELTVDAVVHIRAEFEPRRSTNQDFFQPDDFFDFFFGPRRRPSPQQQRPVVGSGSGVILTPDGYIITNNHVVADATLIEVTLNDNRLFEARKVGTDPTTDLALLKIEENGLPYMIFGDSDALRVGEWVLAIGNPFNLQSTVTAGIVSAKGRNINILTDTMAIESFIQTDAAVNRGNSGGALVNARGELVGINTAIASTTGSFAGYSFAIPSSIALKVMEDLKEFGMVQRGMLGVTISPLTSRIAEEKDLGVIRGAYVERVGESSAADLAGIRQGDVIVAIDGNPVRNPADLIEMVGRKRPGDEVMVTYYRNGRERQTTATLKNIYGEVAAVTRDTKEVVEKLGARFESLPERTLEELGINHGVQVTYVSRGVLSDAGIRRGFIITHLANQPVRSPDDIIKILDGRSGGVLVEGIYPDGRRAYYGIGLN
ncbi:MAG: Do family serine endopeptidase [Bacteroidia bacterium]|nr:MAG: Do family serine endopeptidase [Bacteroidia bacterium]